MSDVIAKLVAAFRIAIRFPLILFAAMAIAKLATLLAPPGFQYEGAERSARWIRLLAIGIPLSFIGAWSVGAFYYALSRYAQDEPVTARGISRSALGRLWSLFWTPLLAGAVTVLGMFCCLVPGIYLSIRLSLVQPVVMLEGLDGWPALKRSWRLTEESVAPLFILGVIGSLLWIPCELIPLWQSGVLSHLDDGEQVRYALAHPGWSQWLLFPVNVVLAVIGHVTLFLFYWDAWPNYVPPEPRTRLQPPQPERGPEVTASP